MNFRFAKTPVASTVVPDPLLITTRALSAASPSNTAELSVNSIRTMSPRTRLAGAVTYVAPPPVPSRTFKLTAVTVGGVRTLKFVLLIVPALVTKSNRTAVHPAPAR